MNGVWMQVSVGIIVSTTAGENVPLDDTCIHIAYSTKIKARSFKHSMRA
jgi:hypothetical protein